MDDAALLQCYVNSGSAEAFNKLMSRYVDLVHSAARRQVRDEHLAQDVTQAVFILLAQKAATVKGAYSLPGWLLLTTYYASRDARKMQMRRRLHEQKAAQMTAARERATDDAAWNLIIPELDAALARLNGKYRSIVAMHFMEGRTFREVGAALGISEDAARMSCARALQKLKRNLSRRGSIVSVGALATMMAAHSVQAAPPQVHAMVSAGASLNAAMIAHRVSGVMQLAKACLVGGAIVSTLLVAVSTVVFLNDGGKLHDALGAGDSASATGFSSSVVPAALSMKANFRVGGHVEFLGVTRLSPQDSASWKADGEPTFLPVASVDSQPAKAFTPADLDHRQLYRFAFHVNNITPKAHDLWMLTSGEPAGFRGTRLQWTNPDAADIVYGVAALAPEQTVANVCVALSTGGWDTIRYDVNGQRMGVAPKGLQTFAPAKVEQRDNGTLLVLPVDPYTRYDFRCVAVGSDFVEYPMSQTAARYVGTVGDASLPAFFFSVPLEKIAHFEFSIRHGRDFVVFRHVSLRPGISNDAFVDANSNLCDPDKSVYDQKYLELFHQVAAAVQAKDSAAARRACASFVAQTAPRVESIEGTSHAYLLVTGRPVLDMLQQKLNARDCDGALSLLDASSPQATHLWQMADQLALRQPVKSLQYP